MSLELRRAFGHFPTGVTVITTTGAHGEPIGMTVNSFSSLSIEPPLVLWSVARASSNFEAFRVAANFAVHVLHAGQAAVARHFAMKDVNRFAGFATTTGCGGSPILPEFHCCFDCVTHVIVEGGDHLIIVGKVLHCEERPGDPLIFYKGRFVDLTPAHPRPQNLQS